MACFFLLAGAALLACGEHGVTNPVSSALAPDGAARRSGAAALSTEIPVASQSSGQEIPLYNTGLIIPKFARYYVRVEGAVNATPASVPCDAWMTKPFFFGPGGASDALGVYVEAGSTRFHTPPSGTKWVSDTARTEEYEAEVSVSRGGYYYLIGCPLAGGGYGGGPLYDLASNQRLVVEILAVDVFELLLKPDLTGPVPADTTITFFESAKTVFDFTYRKNSWLWTPDDGGASVELFPNQCGGSCTFKVASSGTMTVSGTVGGFVDGSRRPVSASSHVTVRTPQIKLTVSSDSVTAGDTVFVTTAIVNAATDSVRGYTFVPTVPPILAARLAVPSPRMQSTILSGVPACLSRSPAPKYCFIVPAGTGTLRVAALADGKEITAERLIKVAARADSLVVKCTPSAPVRGQPVHCVVAMSDHSIFTLKTLRSSRDGQQLVRVNANDDLASYDWHGPAVSSTTVVVDAISNGRPVSATTTFEVTPRTFIDPIQPARPPALPSGGPPTLDHAYPGITDTPTGWRIELGGLGKTWHLFPDYKAARVLSGPNLGLVYVTDFTWVRSKPDGVNPVGDGVFLSKALFPGDLFYEKQDGKDGFCSKSAIDVLRGEIYEHEIQHRAAEIDLRKRLGLRFVYESLVLAFPQGTPTPAILEKVNEAVQVYNKGIQANDAAVDLPALKTSLTGQPRGL